MSTPKLFSSLALTISLMLVNNPVLADEIRIAVASNFTHAIKPIATGFEQQSGHEVTLIFGSTGKHYAQIINGAPFEAFLAADAERPALLEEALIAIPDSRFTYARGKLVLWSPMVNYIDAEGKILQNHEFRHLAIANPKLAPYGKAARQVLEKRGLWEPLQKQMVRGENIGQTYQFVKSGNAELGFVAYSQVKRHGNAVEGSFWELPQSLYTPIDQQAVLLKDHPAANDFFAYMKSAEVRKIISNYGYDLPDAE